LAAKLAEWEVTQPSVLAAADAGLDAGVATMAGLELGRVGLRLVGDEDLKAEPRWSVKVSWAQG